MIERLTALQNRVLERLRHKDAFRLAPSTTGFAHLRGHKYAVLVTFRKSGEAVPTAVWFGVDDEGRVYLRSEAKAGKVKRIRRDPRVLLAPSKVLAKPVGPAAPGRARVLAEGPEAEHAERTIQANYGLGRRLYEGEGHGLDLVYLEITPER